jgi:hypothetical protein
MIVNARLEVSDEQRRALGRAIHGKERDATRADVVALVEMALAGAIDAAGKSGKMTDDRRRPPFSARSELRAVMEELRPQYPGKSESYLRGAATVAIAARKRKKA